MTASLGIRTVVTHDLHPNLANWSASANVPGAGYWVDGLWEPAPYAVSDVVGVRHVLTGMALQQSIAGNPYRFAGWADGSALTDTIAVASGSASFTAQYDAVQNAMPSPWVSTDVG